MLFYQTLYASTVYNAYQKQSFIKKQGRQTESRQTEEDTDNKQSHSGDKVSAQNLQHTHYIVPNKYRIQPKDKLHIPEE